MDGPKIRKNIICVLDHYRPDRETDRPELGDFYLSSKGTLYAMAYPIVCLPIFSLIGFLSKAILV